MAIAAILVGGKGTRLRAALPNLPKPLAPINGEPFLYLLLRNLAAVGIKQIVLLTGYGHEQVQAACGDGKQFNVQIHYSQELEPLGTGGALWNAKRLLEQHQEFLLLNGDTYLDCSLEALAKYRLDNESLGVIGAIQLNGVERYGTLQVEPSTQQIIAFREKNASLQQGLVNAGVYKLSSKILPFIPENTFVSLEQEVFPQLLEKRYQFNYLPLTGMFYDIGLPESYASFNANIIINSANVPVLAKKLLFSLVNNRPIWVISENKPHQWQMPELKKFYELLEKCLTLPGVSIKLNSVSAKEYAASEKLNDSKDLTFAINELTITEYGKSAVPIDKVDWAEIFQVIKAAWVNLQSTIKFLNPHDVYQNW